ncbi:hypothetical protein RFI_12830 [Reticulomyxa filosa]|uniref:Uncharacterized protein n=1 Tax=Reticulomyxa filosa TaxID=46433 RepID=X6NEK5_RETFI|nr:hypothetical protein RFI_12830 [Reticulomyxa filosa]|eukprot:ETO24328.1 hypothetical protein RFI_12830 [Reticulomyxa filosa]
MSFFFKKRKKRKFIGNWSLTPSIKVKFFFFSLKNKKTYLSFEQVQESIQNDILFFLIKMFGEMMGLWKKFVEKGEKMFGK